MKRHIVPAALALLLGLACAAPAPAEAAGNTRQGGAAVPADDKIIEDITIDEMDALLTSMGYQTKINDSDPDALPWIETTTQDGKYNFEVTLYNCDEIVESCLQVQFRAMFETNKAEQAKAREYEVGKVFGRVYLYSDTETYLEHPVHINGGVTTANLKNNVLLWENIITDFVKKLGW